MKPCNLELFELQAELYQMMANPKRLAIVELLSHGEQQRRRAIAEVL